MPKPTKAEIDELRAKAAQLDAIAALYPEDPEAEWPSACDFIEQVHHIITGNG